MLSPSVLNSYETKCGDYFPFTKTAPINHLYFQVLLKQPLRINFQIALQIQSSKNKS